MALFDEIKQSQQGLSREQLAMQAQSLVPINIAQISTDTSKPVPINDLGKDVNIQKPPAESNPSSFVGSLSDSQKYFQDLYNEQKKVFQETQKERETLKNVLGESYKTLEGMPSFYKQQEEQLGIPQQYKDLQNINLQIADLAGAYDKEYARVETKGIQSGTPGIFYQGEQAAMQRQKAVEIGALGVRQAAMAGNLDLANQRAAKTTELQFKPIENKIKQTMQFLEMNYQDMTTAEKRQADNLALTLKFQEQKLAEQKEIRNLALTSGVTQPYFMKVGDPTVYRTQDGKAYTSEQEFLNDGGRWNKIQTINPAEAAQVHQLMKDYGDAGILPSDSLSVATQKVKTQSRKYTKETHITPSPYDIIDYGKNKTKQTFEEFAKQKSETLGVSPGKEMLAEWKKEYEKQQGPDLKNVINTILASSKFTKQQRADVVNYVQNRGLAGAQEWWVSNKFGQSDKSDYQLYETSASILQGILPQLETSLTTDYGPYKSLLESSKPYLKMQQDPKYTELFQAIEMAQAQIRKGFYGTAVTGTEQGNARRFLINPEDSFTTVVTKVNGMLNTLRFVNDANTLRPFGIKVDYNEYQNKQIEITEDLMRKEFELLNSGMSGSKIKDFTSMFSSVDSFFKELNNSLFK